MAQMERMRDCAERGWDIDLTEAEYQAYLAEDE